MMPTWGVLFGFYLKVTGRVWWWVRKKKECEQGKEGSFRSLSIVQVPVSGCVILQGGWGQSPHSQPLSSDSLSSQAQRAGLGLSHLDLCTLTFPVGALHREDLPCLPLGPWWSFLPHRIVSGLKGWFQLCVSAAHLAGPNSFLLSLDMHPRTQDSRSLILDTSSPNWHCVLISFFWVTTLQKGHNKPFHVAPSAMKWCTSGRGYKHSLGA